MNNNTVLRIEGELTIFRATELKPQLVANPNLTEIDLSGVTELDSAGVQLLMLAKKTAMAQQRELRLVSHSPAVIEVFELLNIGSFFGDPMIMESPAGSTRSRHSTTNAARGSNESR